MEEPQSRKLIENLPFYDITTNPNYRHVFEYSDWQENKQYKTIRERLRRSYSDVGASESQLGSGADDRSRKESKNIKLR